MPRVILLAVLLFLPAAAAQAQGCLNLTFGSPADITVGGAPQSLIINDFNRDGLGDLAVASRNFSEVTVHLGSPFGGFGSPATITTGSTPVAITTGDVNADGFLDLVTANSDSNNVSVFLGSGTGSFGTGQTFNTGNSPAAVAIADLNGDGRGDLAVANSNSNSVSILLATTGGSFGTATQYTTGSGPAAIAAADFDADGDIDIATANAVGSVTILYGNGSGGFATPGTSLSSVGGSSIATADFNGDGFSDLVVAGDLVSQVAVILRTGATTWGMPSYFGTGSGPNQVSTSDFNGDGRIDLAVSHATGVSILRGNGSGSFIGPTDITTTAGTDAYGVAAGDIDGDGRTDLAVGSTASTVSTILNSCAAAPVITSVSPATGSESGGTTLTITGRGFRTTTNVQLGGVVMNNATCNQPTRCTATTPAGSGMVAVRANTGGLLSADTPADDFAYIHPSSCSNAGFATSAVALASAQAIAVGDFNSDGRMDLAVGTTTPAISILLGTSTGSFTVAQTLTLTATAQSIAIGDFNGDNASDLAAAHSGGVSFFYGSFGGAFGGAISVASGSFRSVATADFNTDGIADAAAAGNAGLTIILGSTTTALSTTVNLGPGRTPQGLAVTDVNGDGYWDLAIASSGSNDVLILRGNGNGSFDFGARAVLTGTPAFIASADFDSDGDHDFAVANNGDRISMFLGDGLGSIAAASQIILPAGSDPTALTVADADGDGIADLGVVLGGSEKVALFRGSGNGAFVSYWETSADNPTSIEAFYFNGDGRADFVAGHGAGATVFSNGCSNLAVTAINPRQGSTTGGTRITITGTGFDTRPGHTTVMFGTTAATEVLCVSAASCTAVAPAGTGLVNVRVNVGTQSSANTPADDFTYLSLASCASPRFDKTTLPGGVSPRAIATADFNGDGYLDLAVANGGSGASGSETVYVRLGSASGAFSTPISTAVTGSPRHLIAGDFNNDGRADLAVAAHSSNDIAILLGTGIGSFGPATRFPAAQGPTFLVSGDFNNDLQTDLVVAHDGSDDIVIFAGTGTGSFVELAQYAPFTSSTGVRPHTLAIGDFNEDGHLDLAAGKAFNGSVALLLGDGSGAFPTIVDHTVPATRSGTTVTTGDFNRDGHLDVAVAHPAHPYIGVLLGTGTGTLGPRTEYEIVGGRQQIIASDFNSDGFLDLVLLDGNSLQVMRGDGLGGFSSPGSYLVAVTNGITRGIAEGDFNRDGRPDYATANDNTYDVSVLLNICGMRTAVESVTPASGSPEGGTTVTITGTHLSNPTSVQFSFVDATVVSSSATSITAVTPANFPGLAWVSVTTSMGTDGAYLFTYDPYDTTTSLTSSENPSQAGDTLTLTATVAIGTTNAMGGVATKNRPVIHGNSGVTGTMTFRNGTTVLGAVEFSFSTAQLEVTLPRGTHSLTASYEGSTFYKPSTSPVLTQTVMAPFGPPPDFAAWATTTSSIVVSWTEVYAATAYEVHRSSMNSPFAHRMTVSSTVFEDTGLSPGTTYLYKVRAVAMATSAFTPIAWATTIKFTDAVLAGQPVRVVHMEELRTAAQAMRAAAGLAPFSFTGPTLTAGTTVIASAHFAEINLAMQQALGQWGTFPTYPVTTPEPGEVIQAAHANVLRGWTGGFTDPIEVEFNRR